MDTSNAGTGQPAKDQGPDLRGQSAVDDRRNDDATAHRPAGGTPPVADRPVTPPPVSGPGHAVQEATADPTRTPRSCWRSPGQRSAAEDKLTRKVVAQAIRGQQIPLSSDTLTDLMAQLRQQHGQPVTHPGT